MKQQLEKLLQGIWTVAVVDNQYGDGGKGKISEMMAAFWADLTIRCAGGANAGHTTLVHGKEHVFHLLPCSSLLPEKVSMVGKGVAFDPRVALEELDILRNEGVSSKNIFISYLAHLVLPQHIVLDRVREAVRGGIGTTQRGIGPLYTDIPARCGLIVNDLLDPDTFRRKLERNLAEKVKLLKLVDPEIIRKAMEDPYLSQFYCKRNIFSWEAIMEVYLDCGKELKALIADTDGMVREALGKKRILLEGAQALLLSVHHGAHPYVTSSDCSVAGLAQGAGLSERDIGMTFGIVKAPYMTRVGGGPFPTEIGGEDAARRCNEALVGYREIEKRENPHPDINDPDPWKQNIAIRDKGNEFGATTGRPRRIGWVDKPKLRYAMQFNGPNLVITKPDVMDECEEIAVCDSYQYTGRPRWWGGKLIKTGDELLIAPMEGEILKYCTPHYVYFPGWLCSIRKCKTYEELPENLRTILKFIDGRIRMVSVGPDRDETIIVAD